MKVLEIIIDKIELGLPKECRLIFQGKISSDISINSSNEPIFNDNSIIVPYSIDRDGKSILIVSLLVINNDNNIIKEEVVGNQLVFIEPLDTGSYNKLSLIMNSTHGYLMNASISLKYKIKSIDYINNEIVDVNKWYISCNFISQSTNQVTNNSIKIKLKYNNNIKSNNSLTNKDFYTFLYTMIDWNISDLSIDICNNDDSLIINIPLRLDSCISYCINITSDLSVLLFIQSIKNSSNGIINNYSITGTNDDTSNNDRLVLYLTYDNYADEVIVSGITSLKSQLVCPSTGSYITINNSYNTLISNQPNRDVINGYMDILTSPIIKFKIYLLHISILPCTIENQLSTENIITILSKGEIIEKSRQLIDNQNIAFLESKLVDKSNKNITVQFYLTLNNDTTTNHMKKSKNPNLTIPPLDLPVLNSQPELLGYSFDIYPTPPETPINERTRTVDKVTADDRIDNPVDFGDTVDVNRLVGTNVIPGTTIGLIDLIKQEQIEKQKIIDKLLADTDNKNQIINDVNDEIRLLKEEIRQLKLRLLEAEGIISDQVNEMNETIKQTQYLLNIDMKTLDNLNNQALKKIIIYIIKIYKLLEIEKNNLLLDNNENVKMKNDYLKLRRLHEELEYAHKKQSNQIFHFSNQFDNYNKYKYTVILQEKIIEKLQNQLNYRLDNKSDSKVDSKIDSKINSLVNNELYSSVDSDGLYDRVNIEFDNAMNDIREGRDTIIGFHSQLINSNLADQNNMTTGSPKTTKQASELSQQLAEANNRVQYLETEMSSKDIRISALEDQLIKSAREHASELSRLRTKLFEFEIASTIDIVNTTTNAQIDDIDVDKDNNISKYPSGKALNAANAIRQNKI